MDVVRNQGRDVGVLRCSCLMRGLGGMMIVPLQKLTAAEPDDAVRSKPTPNAGCEDWSNAVNTF